MLTVEWNKGDLNNFYSKIDKICSNLQKHAKTGIEKATKETQQTALSKKVGNKDESMILTEINDERIIEGRVYTNFHYAPFLEYGTGIEAELPHIGTTKTFIKSGFTYWFLPVEKCDRDLPNQIITIGDKEFYLMFSQQPKPFMRPTAFERRNPNIETIKESIIKGIEEDIK